MDEYIRRYFTIDGTSSLKLSLDMQNQNPHLIHHLSWFSQLFAQLMVEPNVQKDTQATLSVTAIGCIC